MPLQNPWLDDGAVLEFGKCEGRPIRRVPDEYLRWLVHNVEITPELRDRICERLGIRKVYLRCELEEIAASSARMLLERPG